MSMKLNGPGGQPWRPQTGPGAQNPFSQIAMRMAGNARAQRNQQPQQQPGGGFHNMPAGATLWQQPMMQQQQPMAPMMQQQPQPMMQPQPMAPMMQPQQPGGGRVPDAFDVPGIMRTRGMGRGIQ